MNLPGTIRKIKATDHDDEGCYHEGCEKRPDWSVQGETDSMGAEYAYYCDEHIEAYKKAVKDAPVVEHICDGCGKTAELFPSRSWEEGNNGPVYSWCRDCRASDAKSLAESFPDDLLNEGDEDEDYHPSGIADWDVEDAQYEADREEFEKQEELNRKTVYAFVTDQTQMDCDVIKTLGDEFLWDGFKLIPNSTGRCVAALGGEIGPYKVLLWTEFKDGNLELTMAYRHKEQAERIPEPMNVIEMAIWCIQYAEEHVSTPTKITAVPHPDI